MEFTGNEVRLVVNNDIAELFINDVPLKNSQKQPYILIDLFITRTFTLTKESDSF